MTFGGDRPRKGVDRSEAREGYIGRGNKNKDPKVENLEASEAYRHESR